MKIIQKYILKEALLAIALSSLACCSLFMAFDFFDRIDNVLKANASFGQIISYFSYKVPIFFNLTLPLAMLVGTMLSFGMLSKNSELTAMRAAGLKISWFAKPLFYIAFILSLFSLFLNETVIPNATRRVREIYNIEIKAKHKTGTYSQSNFWWRNGENFYSAKHFDSRNANLVGFSNFVVTPEFEVTERTSSKEVSWLHELYGWRMKDSKQLFFNKNKNTATELTETDSLPLIIPEKPKDFYDKETDPFTMSFSELNSFIKKQQRNGIPTQQYYADLHAKLSFPFVCFMVTLVALPFALVSSRSGNLAKSFFLGLIASFSYYAVHSFSLALGRAEIWNPIFAAWVANILLGFIGCVLLLGAEAPE